MNEATARDVVLVRSVESADTDRVIFSDQDRAYAGRAAAELARWQAAERKQAASAASFIGQRAELLCRTLDQRAPTLAAAARAFEWPAWVGVALPLLAFVFGVLVEHISDRHHINVLAFPLLAIVLWNIVIYLLLAFNWLLRISGALGGRPMHVIDLRGPRRWLTAIRQRATRGGTGAAAAARDAFAAEWSERVAPLMTARAARVLHLAAAMFATGAIAGLYVRGLVFEYRAGWESTFLDAPAVHAILSFFLEPAARVLGAPFPTVDEVAAMRFTGDPAAASTSAARWIHLYAVSVGVIVILPRLMLALIARLQEQHRAHAFAFDLNDPYFRRLAGPFTGGATRLRVIPYSFTLDEAAHDGLKAVAKSLLGDEADVALLAPVAFGAEAAWGAQTTRALTHGDPLVALTVALFSLTATPENENHGVFLKNLREAVHSQSSTGLAVLVDESAFRRRLGISTGVDAVAHPRLAERRDAWRYFCKAIGVEPVFADLSNPDLPAIERDFSQRQPSGNVAAPAAARK